MTSRDVMMFIGLVDDSGVLHEVLSDDGVQNDEDCQGDEEEYGDGGDEVGSSPEGVSLREADWNYGSIEVFGVVVRSNAKNWTEIKIKKQY